MNLHSTTGGELVPNGCEGGKSIIGRILPFGSLAPVHENYGGTFSAV